MNYDNVEKKIVWSCNEWDPLEEVIVGRVENAVVPSLSDPEVNAIVPDHAEWFFEKYGGQPFPQDMIEKATAELEGLVKVFEERGVTVRRPNALDSSVEFKTPWWSSKGLYTAMPRDIFLVVADTIIEAPMAWRSRYFESHDFRDIIDDYFDKGAKWLAAPKSLMVDHFYNPDYDPDHPVDSEGNRQFVISENEIAFDAADFLRFGKDIVVQKSNVTNGRGIEWVRRHLPNDFTIHEVHFGDDHPMHIDTSITPLCPGKLLINPDWVSKEDLPDFLQKWEIIEAPKPVFTNDNALYFSSDWLTINFVSVDEKTVIVEEKEEPLIELLQSHGMDVITIPFRNFYQFGGSTHCATTDIRRRGNLQSY